MRRVIIKMMAVFAATVIICCTVPTPAEAIFSQPFVTEGQVEQGTWNGEPWPVGATMGIEWQWDTSLAPYHFVPNAGAEWWSFASPFKGFNLIDVFGVPIAGNALSDWNVQIFYGGFGSSFDQMFISATLVDGYLIEWELDWAPGTLPQGVLPGNLNMHDYVGGIVFIDKQPDTSLIVDLENVYTTPEPSTLILMLAGVAGVAVYMRRVSQ